MSSHSKQVGGSSAEASNAAGPGSAPRRGVLAELLGQRAFIACALLLLVLAAGYEGLAHVRKMQPWKAALPLRKPLSQLDATRLPGYVLKHVSEIKPEVLGQLGTDQYIQWYLVDKARENNPRPEDVIHLFITYYTGQPDQVPHVPEECYQGGGYKVQNSSFVDIPIPALGEGATAPVQVLQIATPSYMGAQQRTVVYTFHTNGQFCSNRRCVQQAIGSPYAKHAYFSKLELSFGLPDTLPTREAALASATRFLQELIPVLLAEHWPDWSKAEAEAAATLPAAAVEP